LLTVNLDDLRDRFGQAEHLQILGKCTLFHRRRVKQIVDTAQENFGGTLNALDQLDELLVGGRKQEDAADTEDTFEGQAHLVGDRRCQHVHLLLHLVRLSEPERTREVLEDQDAALFVVEDQCFHGCLDDVHAVLLVGLVHRHVSS